MPSLFNAIFSRIRPAQLDARAPQRKVSVVEQQGLRRTGAGQEQAVHVEISARVADVLDLGMRALPGGSGNEADSRSAPSAYAVHGNRARAQRAARQWQREFGAAVHDTNQAPTSHAPAPATAHAPLAAESGASMAEGADESWAGHGLRTVVAMALRAYTRIFDPDPTFSAVL